jgi:hypothetical protein
MSRRRSALVLLLSLIFVGAGALILQQSSWVAWLAFVFGGVGVVAAILELIRPSYLRLEPQGFTSWRLFRPTRRGTWADSSPFSTVEVSRQSLIAYLPDGGSSSSPARGPEKYLAPGYGGLTAAQLADLLNEYRDRALGRP